ncbi:MAG: hypothetical protein BWY83_00402 [bacterium ADurb.Bin478]|nr:MAG: hypothetical protein BWY83_00402 [bacterium ADurb.Bin478]
MTPKDFIPQRMKRSNRHSLFVQVFGNGNAALHQPLHHLLGRFFVERQCEDLMAGHALIDQMDDAVDQRLGLAGTSRRQHANRAVEPTDGVDLRFIQILVHGQGGALFLQRCSLQLKRAVQHGAKVLEQNLRGQLLAGVMQPIAVQTRCVKRARPSGKKRKRFGRLQQGENNLILQYGQHVQKRRQGEVLIDRDLVKFFMIQ